MKKVKTLNINLAKIIIIALLFFVASGEAFAATYYVSPAGSDSSSGSVSAPFKTIQKAADVVNAGDTVIVKNGTYTDANSDDTIVSLNRGGTSGSWITFKAENKWGAILDCQSNTASYGWLNLTNARYISIEGFEIKGCANVGIHSNSGSNNHDINIYNNYIHHIGRLTTNNAYGLVGIFMGGGTYNFTIDSNLFNDIGRLNPYTTPTASEASCTLSGAINCYNHDHAIYSYGHDHAVINNIFREMESGWAIQLAGGTPPDGPNWKILNNTFYGANAQRDGHILLWAAYSTPTNVLIQNNISYGARTAFVRSTSGSSTWQLKNNLVYGASLVSGATNYTQSGNITGQDPKFVNVTNKDFHLQSGSPAIDKGASIAGYDYDADEKPIVGAPDIGAYEYAGSTTPPTQDITAPSVPTGLTATAVSSSQINLAWKASTDNIGVSGYKVYRGTTLIATTTTTSYANTGLAASTAYTYSVSAFDTTGNVSSQSVAASVTTPVASADITAPSVPTGLTATAVSSSQVNLSWTASSDNVGVTGYRVYRNGTQIATATTTSFSNTGLTASTSYTYAVSAYDAAGNASGQSASVSATTASTVSTVPTVIIDNGKSGTSYTGTWGISRGTGQYGTTSLYSRDGAKYTWTFTPKTSGKYDVSMWWTEFSTRSTEVLVDISYLGGTKEVYVNQQQNGSKWNSLSSYYFEAGKSYKITITAQPGPSSTNADAVRFVYMGAK